MAFTIDNDRADMFAVTPSIKKEKSNVTRALFLLSTCKALVRLQDPAFIEQYGARNSRPDLKMLQDVHDLTVRLGAKCQEKEAKE